MYTCIFAFPYCFRVFLKTTRATRCCVRAFAVRFKSRSSPMVIFFFSLRHLRKISLHDMTEEPVPVVWYPVHVVRVYSPPSTGTALKPFFSYSRTGSEKRKWQTRPNKKPHGLCHVGNCKLLFEPPSPPNSNNFFPKPQALCPALLYYSVRQTALRLCGFQARAYRKKQTLVFLSF